MIKNNIYDIWFARVEVSNSIKLRLYKKFCTEELYNFNENDFLNQGLKAKAIDRFLNYKYRKNLNIYKLLMEKNNIFQIFCDNEIYPERLRYISDCPTYIFASRKSRFNV